MCVCVCVLFFFFHKVSSSSIATRHYPRPLASLSTYTFIGVSLSIRGRFEKNLSGSRFYTLGERERERDAAKKRRSKGASCEKG